MLMLPLRLQSASGLTVECRLHGSRLSTQQALSTHCTVVGVAVVPLGEKVGGPPVVISPVLLPYICMQYQGFTVRSKLSIGGFACARRWLPCGSPPRCARAPP